MSAAKAAAKDAAIARSGYADEYAAGTENYDEACSLAATIKAFFLAPVLGGVGWRALYQACALGVFAFFVYTVSAVVPTWSEKVTAATTEFQESFPIPDIYACVPAETMAEPYVTARSRGTFVFDTSQVDQGPAGWSILST